jgi:hypothetical protein
MPITPTNQTKNIVSPQNLPKAGIYLWGDTLYTWGDAIATWGGILLSPTNQSKNTVSPTNQTKS